MIRGTSLYADAGVGAQIQPFLTVLSPGTPTLVFYENKYAPFPEADVEKRFYLPERERFLCVCGKAGNR